MQLLCVLQALGVLGNGRRAEAISQLIRGVVLSPEVTDGHEEQVACTDGANVEFALLFGSMNAHAGGGETLEPNTNRFAILRITAFQVAEVRERGAGYCP